MANTWPKHGYSVRNVKTFRGMEGEGFNATLYREGRRIAFVIDDASGGDIQIQWANRRTRDVEEKRLLEFLKTLPKDRWEDQEYDVTPDVFMATLVDQSQIEKRLKRLFEKKTLFRLREDSTEDDNWRVIERPFSPAIKAALVKKYGGRLGQILNEDYPHLNPGAQ